MPPGMGDGGMMPPGMGPPGTGVAAAPQMKDQPITVTPGSPVTLSGDNTSISFVGKKADGQHTGGFKTLTGTVELSDDSKTPTKIEVEIDTESLWSDNPMLTNHLKNADFFDTKTHGKASFVTTEITPADGAGQTHSLTGELSLHGVTNTVTVPATVVADGSLFSLKSKFVINRQDFGMTYSPEKVNNEVEIVVTIGVAPQ